GQAVCEIKAQCSFVEHEGLEIGRGERKRHMHCQVIKAQVPISWLFSRRRTSFLPIGEKIKAGQFQVTKIACQHKIDCDTASGAGTSGRLQLRSQDLDTIKYTVGRLVEVFSL